MRIVYPDIRSFLSIIPCEEGDVYRGLSKKQREALTEVQLVMRALGHRIEQKREGIPLETLGLLEQSRDVGAVRRQDFLRAKIGCKNSPLC